MKKIRIIVLIFLLIFLTGCNNKNQNEDLKGKLASEMEFLDLKIMDILNNLNNISFKNYRIESEKVSLSEKSRLG